MLEWISSRMFPEDFRFHFLRLHFHRHVPPKSKIENIRQDLCMAIILQHNSGRNTVMPVSNYVENAIRLLLVHFDLRQVDDQCEMTSRYRWKWMKIVMTIGLTIVAIQQIKKKRRSTTWISVIDEKMFLTMSLEDRRMRVCWWIDV